MRTRQIRVIGRVQGVGYRYALRDEALRLGVAGWVRNRADGSVEALLIGDEDAVAAMIEACQEGPFAARVANVAVSDAEDDGSAGFRPLPTA